MPNPTQCPECGGALPFAHEATAANPGGGCKYYILRRLLEGYGVDVDSERMDAWIRWYCAWDQPAMDALLRAIRQAYDAGSS